MSDITTAFWGMTINNYDETDLALVRQGYPDYIRKITFTLEQGEKGTPHIQAWLKLNRQQRLSYVKKLFPRGNFKALTSDEYKLNAEAYSTKQDDTARSPSVIINNPFPDPVVELVSVIRDALEHFHESSSVLEWRKTGLKQIEKWTTMVENSRVVDKPSLAKFYISPTYVKVWRNFGASLVEHVCSVVEKERENIGHTHTHTHSDEKFSHEGGITDDGERDIQEGIWHEAGSSQEGEESEGDEDCESESSEGFDESGSSCSSASDSFSEC